MLMLEATVRSRWPGPALAGGQWCERASLSHQASCPAWDISNNHLTQGKANPDAGDLGAGN